MIVVILRRWLKEKVPPKHSPTGILASSRTERPGEQAARLRCSGITTLIDSKHDIAHSKVMVIDQTISLVRPNPKWYASTDPTRRLLHMDYQQQFSLQPHKLLRDEIMFYIRDIYRTEVFGCSALVVMYAWLVTHRSEMASLSPLISWAFWFLPVLVVLFGSVRCGLFILRIDHIAGFINKGSGKESVRPRNSPWLGALQAVSIDSPASECSRQGDGDMEGNLCDRGS